MSADESVGRVAAEARARAVIDRHLTDAGWSVQDKKAMNLFAAASSAGQHNLSLAKLDAIELPVPSLAEQDDRLARVADMRELANRMRAELDAAELHSAALRRSLLAAAFAGRLTGDREVAGV